MMLPPVMGYRCPQALLLGITLFTAQEIFYQQAPWITLATGKTFYATRSNVSGYSVSLMGSDFSKAKLN
ncbi:hypothetical protein A3N43_11805 [Klebsiella aerogenes]|nr:hypothetical protein A3N43_11805 [Klebsiella aerogenes]